MKIQVVSVNQKEGIGAKSQKAYKMITCGIVYADYKNEQQVGNITYFTDATKPFPVVEKGMYDIQFSLSFKDGKLVPNIASLKKAS